MIVSALYATCVGSCKLPRRQGDQYNRPSESRCSAQVAPRGSHSHVWLTTIAGLSVLERGAVRRTLISSVELVAIRSTELV